MRLGLALAALALPACTFRYSQTLIGTIEKRRSRPVVNSSDGYGLSAGLSLHGIAELPIEPEQDADSLANPSCEAAMVQVDQRALWVLIPLGPVALSYVQPRTQTVTFCVAD